MEQIATTRLSSRGQVVIPEEIRKRLGLEAGAQFIVIGGKGVVILKAIAPPSMSEFTELLDEAKKAARSAGMKRSDIRKATRRARSGR